MDEHSGRTCRPATAESGRGTRPACPPPSDLLASLCAAHGPVESAGRFPPGTIFGDWRLTAFIGRGGNGEVYCAEHATLGTPAAVKVLVREEPRAKERFAREAKLLSELKSTSFPQFFSYGESNGFPYIAMELLEPGDLPKGEGAIARFLLDVCDAVAELHAQGLVHRDIKPGNILWRMVGSRVPRDRRRAVRASLPAVPVLADLGLIKEIRTSDLGLQTSSITIGGVGTPGYGAPEQMERGEATPAVDIHALGVLADRCFGGHPPRAWARIIERATSSIPARRYPTVAAFARAIRRRNLLLKSSMTVACVGMLAIAGIALRIEVAPPDVPQRSTQPEGGETFNESGRAVAPRPLRTARGAVPTEQAPPVLFASAMLDGVEMKDAHWFLDDDPIEMPHRFDGLDRRGKVRSYRWLRAVARRNGKIYSAKMEGIVPVWKGDRHFSLKLREDPADGTRMRIWSPKGVPFDFVWCSPREGAAGSVGYGYWMSAHGLTGRQLGAIVQDGELYTPFTATRRYQFSSDDLVRLEHPDSATIPVFSFRGVDVKIGPPSAIQLEDAVWRMGKAAEGMFLAATSSFANETNTFLHCEIVGLLRSGSPGDVAKGEKILLGFIDSDDREFAFTSREMCIERGLLSLESCGANPASRFRRAAVRNGNAQVLERLATTDPNSDIRMEAYERIRNPSQMVSARYVARITAHFSGDLRNPIQIIQNMTDRAALEYVIKHASLDYFQDLAKERLASLEQ